jgi:hypothetical protein
MAGYFNCTTKMLQSLLDIYFRYEAIQIQNDDTKVLS